ncbi:MAG: PEP-CTERM sorting domain-containing protein [Luteolibacter sp.]
MQKILFTLLAASAVAQAATVRVDFGGTASTDTTWNQLDLGDSGKALKDTTGANSSIIVSYSIAGNNFSGGGWTQGSSAVTDETVYADWIGGNSNNANNNLVTITISGLNSLATYDLAFGGANAANNNFTMTTSLNGTPLGTSSTDRYYTANGVSGASNIVITINDNVRNSGIASLEITQVPEPSAAMLGAIGMLCLLRRRR